MFREIFKALFIPFAICIASFLWAELYSFSAAFYFGFLALFIYCFVESWFKFQLLSNLQKDDLIGKKRGLGIWREIYYQLEKKSKIWRQEVIQSEVQYHKFIQAIQASPNGLIMLDENDHIEWCNNICRGHFRLDPLRDTGQPVTFLLRNPQFVLYMQARDFSRPLHLDFMGEQGSLMLMVQIFPYGENRKLLLSQDITILKKNESMRQDFVANVSHELRTPLTVVSGFLETLRDLKISKVDQSRYVDLMYAQTSRMMTLVEELLILTRLDSSPLTSKTTKVIVEDLFDKLLVDAKSLSQGKHLIEANCSLKMAILGSDSELLSAFGNLIVNAIRYTPEGGKIIFEWKSDQDGGGVFFVKDSGIGIASEHIPRITERFYRVDRSRSRDTGGTGLGLAIVKHVASRHNAVLKIESELAVGSDFSIHFPKDRLVELN
ncbi:phosphate regulon sensor histidine kinase PhoR [Polynucleobacter kasalickyi]|uniref:histidine kinase n=1 Tax=Polynucleobacter kasalickyi TaxID=1938817 RepID=A0A1W1ZVZ0_9BURK|nr:phosphate regulon sensor histidine kinase PhoR [Polynucleobacter kasalickyi]SMC52590.1 PAS/PAC sensor signal transduction histidine kinase [Polynucleobacter kasalickyi]